MDETFSSVDFVAQCLMDEERTIAFRKAIEKAIGPDSVVLDSGTGSGILAMFAARAGAKKVISIEMDPYIAKLAKQNVAENNLSHIIEVVNEDIRNYRFSEGTHFDVVLMEMLTTGMIDEYQVWAINLLHDRGVVDEKTIFIPGRQDTYVSLAYTDFKMYDFSIKMPLHFWSWLKQDHRLQKKSEDTLLHAINFSEKTSENFSQEISISITEDGEVNSMYITSESILSDTEVLRDTLALNGPAVIPLDQPITVRAGEVIKLQITYFFGNGYRNFSAKVVY